MPWANRLERKLAPKSLGSAGALGHAQCEPCQHQRVEEFLSWRVMGGSRQAIVGVRAVRILYYDPQSGMIRYPSVRLGSHGELKGPG